MVRDELWEEHGAGDGMLCIGCLEKRVGRRLVGTDFRYIPFYEKHEVCSRRLLQRLRSRGAPRRGASPQLEIDFDLPASTSRRAPP
jgi:hypothetical protein